MRNGIQVGVVGTATLAPRDPRGMALEEALYAASQMALRDAGMTFDDIDGVVVASSDELDGRAISIMAASGSVGGVERDIMSTPSSAEHAFVLGALRVRSGLYRTQLIVSWSPLEVDSVSAVQQLGTDPYFHRALPIDELSASAMQASALAEQVPGLHDAAVSIVSNNRKNGRLAHAEFAGAVSHHYDGAETEVTSAFHDFGHTLGVDHGLKQFFFFGQVVFVIQVSSYQKSRPALRAPSARAFTRP